MVVATLFPVVVAALGGLWWILIVVGALITMSLAGDGARLRALLAYVGLGALGLALAWYAPGGIGRMLYAFRVMVVAWLLGTVGGPLVLVLAPGLALAWAVQAWIARSLPIPDEHPPTPRALTVTWLGLSLALGLPILLLLAPGSWSFELFGRELSLNPTTVEGGRLRVLVSTFAVAELLALGLVSVGHVAWRAHRDHLASLSGAR
jgi:hypothetical protein